MKPTTDGRWAHLACAIWIPGSILTICYIFCMCLLSTTDLGGFTFIIQDVAVTLVILSRNMLIGCQEDGTH